MNQSVLKLTVSTTESEHRLLVQTDIRLLELMYPNVMLMDSTYHCRLA